ncbi:hypothetical protein BpHYR1_021839 [Brachionus plicatilis]|uniref:Uncharacterized protein n=1 Tax=Brachionus plicatilis TaxID=10195 RepID=A0A3M7T4H8_BRAPC|nr:hypothetical protein BpHYR1_021839 [Brachionus plicatilis]
MRSLISLSFCCIKSAKAPKSTYKSSRILADAAPQPFQLEAGGGTVRAQLNLVEQCAHFVFDYELDVFGLLAGDGQRHVLRRVQIGVGYAKAVGAVEHVAGGARRVVVLGEVEARRRFQRWQTVQVAGVGVGV